MPTKRRTGAAAVIRVGVSAGSIDSSNGSASVTPAPRRNVRRARCFFETNIACLLHVHSQRPTSNSQMATKPAWKLGIGNWEVTSYRRTNRNWFVALHSHLKLRAPHDPEHNRRQPVVILLDVMRNRSDSRHVGELEPAADCVGHHLLDEHPHELR